MVGHRLEEQHIASGWCGFTAKYFSGIGAESSKADSRE